LTRKRSREEISEAILRRAREPEATVTSITIGLGVAWSTWLIVSEDMIKRGHLTRKNGCYQSTEKGLSWLEMREKMNA
jgi:predicted transcriptional regulator